jgi:hypothetical protein
VDRVIAQSIQLMQKPILLNYKTPQIREYLANAAALGLGDHWVAFALHRFTLPGTCC